MKKKKSSAPWRCLINLREATILLVDDEPDLLEIFGCWLDSHSCKLYRASNGEEALAVLKATSIDLLVSDVRMPVMDGIALVRRLAELDKSVPSVVFVSGFGDIDQREMYSLGVEAFLAKPVSRENFIDVLKRAAAERESLRLNPVASTSRQSLVLDAQRISEIANRNPIILGRGGFSAHAEESLTLGKVSFQCKFGPGEQEMSGQGIVRWYSRADQAVGIEFSFLDPPCRSWVLKEITAANPRSFIPNHWKPLQTNGVNCIGIPGEVQVNSSIMKA